MNRKLLYGRLECGIGYMMQKPSTNLDGAAAGIRTAFCPRGNGGLKLFADYFTDLNHNGIIGLGYSGDFFFPALDFVKLPWGAGSLHEKTTRSHSRV